MTDNNITTHMSCKSFEQFYQVTTMLNSLIKHHKTSIIKHIILDTLVGFMFPTVILSIAVMKNLSKI